MPVQVCCTSLRLSLSVVLLCGAPLWRSFFLWRSQIDDVHVSNVMRLSPAIDSCFHEQALGRKRGVGSSCK